MTTRIKKQIIPTRCIKCTDDDVLEIRVRGNYRIAICPTCNAEYYDFRMEDKKLTTIQPMQGKYIIRAIDQYNRPIYVSKVYKGKVDYVTDYLYAKRYTRKESAERIIEQYIEPIEV